MIINIDCIIIEKKYCVFLDMTLNFSAAPDTLEM